MELLEPDMHRVWEQSRVCRDHTGASHTETPQTGCSVEHGASLNEPRKSALSHFLQPSFTRQSSYHWNIFLHCLYSCCISAGVIGRLPFSVNMHVYLLLSTTIIKRGSMAYIKLTNNHKTVSTTIKYIHSNHNMFRFY
jgi:hypothetical protein